MLHYETKRLNKSTIQQFNKRSDSTNQQYAKTQ